MKIISLLKSLENIGEAATVPSKMKEQVKQLENLGGRVTQTNVDELLAQQNLTVSQAERLYQRLKDSGNLSSNAEWEYERFLKMKDRLPPESKALADRLNFASRALLRDVVVRAVDHNYEENLQAVKTFNEGKSFREQVRFSEFFEQRPAYPKGYDNVVKGFDKVDLNSLVKITEDSKNKAVKDNAIKTEGNVTSVDFASLKRIK